MHARSFLRGNLHTHTLLSDGDSPPEAVAAAYREAGYQFLAITDHNLNTDAKFCAEQSRPGFTMIQGEEVTMWSRGKPVHVNAICTTSTIGGGELPSAKEALSRAVREIAKQNGVALVNHPNFEWALTADDLTAAGGAALLEVWSGHPHVRTDGDADHPSHRALWTSALDASLRFAPAAIDDMHHLRSDAKEPAARPFRAWVLVWAEENSPRAICEALGKRRVIASNGPQIAALDVTGNTLFVKASTPVTVTFYGARNEVLAKLGGSDAAEYNLRGGEIFVRAEVTDRDGKTAWTPAFEVR